MFKLTERLPGVKQSISQKLSVLLSNTCQTVLGKSSSKSGSKKGKGSKIGVQICATMCNAGPVAHATGGRHNLRFGKDCDAIRNSATAAGGHDRFSGCFRSYRVARGF